MKKKLDSYLMSHRRRCGFSQGELSYLLGYRNQSALSRLEGSKRDPTFAVAMGCQILFGPPPTEIFPGAFARLEESVLTRAQDLYDRLQGDSSKETKMKLDALEAAFDRWKNRKNSKSV